jgi:hypothetical protein
MSRTTFAGTEAALPHWLAMHKAEAYRKHAEECRKLARRTRAAVDREMLLNMAKTWEELASARLTHVAQQQRITSGTGGDDRSGATIPIDKLNASNDE